MRNQIAQECAIEIRKAVVESIKEIKERNIDVQHIHIGIIDVTRQDQVEYVVGNVSIKIGVTDKRGHY